MVGKLVPMSEPIHIIIDSPALDLCGSALTFIVFFIVGYIGFQILSVLFIVVYDNLRYRFSEYCQRKDLEIWEKEWDKRNEIMSKVENAFWEKHFAEFKIESPKEEDKE